MNIKWKAVLEFLFRWFNLVLSRLFKIIQNQKLTSSENIISKFNIENSGMKNQFYLKLKEKLNENNHFTVKYYIKIMKQ